MGVRRRYWPLVSVWASVLAMICITVFIYASAVAIAGRHFSVVAWIVTAFAVLMLGVGLVLRKVRERFDYYYTSDGESWLSRWAPRGEIVVEKKDVTRIELLDDGFIVHGQDCSIEVNSAVIGYAQLRRMVQQWM